MQTVRASLIPIMLGVVTASDAKPNLFMRLAVEDVRVVPASSCCAEIVMTVKATVVNRGSRAALLFVAEKPVIVSLTLGDAAKRTLPGAGLVTEYRGPSVDTSAKWDAYAAKLERPVSDDAGLIGIPPGGTFEVIQEAAVSVPNAAGPSFYFPKRPSLDELRRIRELWISGVLSVWPINIERARKGKNNSFGRKIQKKWRGVGDLVLQALVAEPVRLGRVTDWEVPAR